MQFKHISKVPSTSPHLYIATHDRRDCYQSTNPPTLHSCCPRRVSSQRVPSYLLSPNSNVIFACFVVTFR